MKTIKPILGWWDVECPVYDGEFCICQITQTKCPTPIEDETTGDYSFEFPIDCPAKEGITVKI